MRYIITESNDSMIIVYDMIDKEYYKETGYSIKEAELYGLHLNNRYEMHRHPLYPEDNADRDAWLLDRNNYVTLPTSDNCRQNNYWSFIDIEGADLVTLQYTDKVPPFSVIDINVGSKSALLLDYNGGKRVEINMAIADSCSLLIDGDIEITRLTLGRDSVSQLMYDRMVLDEPYIKEIPKVIKGEATSRVQILNGSVNIRKLVISGYTEGIKEFMRCLCSCMDIMYPTAIDIQTSLSNIDELALPMLSKLKLSGTESTDRLKLKVMHPQLVEEGSVTVDMSEWFGKCCTFTVCSDIPIKVSIKCKYGTVDLDRVRGKLEVSHIICRKDTWKREIPCHKELEAHGGVICEGNRLLYVLYPKEKRVDIYDMMFTGVTQKALGRFVKCRSDGIFGSLIKR